MYENNNCNNNKSVTSNGGNENNDEGNDDDNDTDGVRSVHDWPQRAPSPGAAELVQPALGGAAERTIRLAILAEPEEGVRKVPNIKIIVVIHIILSPPPFITIVL